ncbi:GNAT family N-acetyltransferase [Deinococcus roseus]|uniref:N-acetyltransferase domain-containing protein n=1 Tax=Deinococcus roseus TaxID=392414 RepID=A0ABQ2DDG4_9DEIO|nr:GNAT family N-acetyltransferase [Deinococcus roseus]GGJ52797.1 hypothetical protein GCM10008938_43480 [Deinococcus roseus]
MTSIAPVAPLFVDQDFAARLEQFNTQVAAAYVMGLQRLSPESEAQILPVGAGMALLMGRDHPINRISGAEFSGGTAHEWQQAEDLYRSCGLSPAVSFSSLGKPEVLHDLMERQYRVASLSGKFVLPIRAFRPEPLAGFRVERVTDRETWVQAVHLAWEMQCTEASALFNVVSLERPGTTCLVVHQGDQVAAVACVQVLDGLAFLNGDATVPAFRRQGLHQLLLQTRLALAAEQGAEFALLVADAGSASARHVQAQGFHLAYTQLNLQQA